MPKILMPKSRLLTSSEAAGVCNTKMRSQRTWARDFDRDVVEVRKALCAALGDGTRMLVDVYGGSSQGGRYLQKRIRGCRSV